MLICRSNQLISPNGDTFTLFLFNYKPIISWKKVGVTNLLFNSILAFGKIFSLVTGARLKFVQHSPSKS